MLAPLPVTPVTAMTTKTFTASLGSTTERERLSKATDLDKNFCNVIPFFSVDLFYLLPVLVLVRLEPTNLLLFFNIE